MELKKVVAALGLGEGAYCALYPLWETFHGRWDGKVPAFAETAFLEQWYPYVQGAAWEEIQPRVSAVQGLLREIPELAAYLAFLHEVTYCRPGLFHCGALTPPVPLGENEGIFNLMLGLSSAPLVEENCRRHGIPLKYAHDALKWLGGTIAFYRLAHGGVPGMTYSQTYWMKYHVDGQLYRIGRFEYLLHPVQAWAPLVWRAPDGRTAAMCAPDLRLGADGLAVHGGVADSEVRVVSFVREDGDLVTGIPLDGEGHACVEETLTLDRREWRPVAAPWDLVPSIHIPGGERMSPTLVEDSLLEAWAFFRQFLHREVPMITCNSWILNPAFRKFAPEGNMAALQRRFHCAPGLRWGNEGRDGMFFAFGHQKCAPTEQPAQTKLQRLLQQVYAAEGTLRTGAMYILPEDLA